LRFSTVRSWFSPEEFSVKTARVCPPTVCRVNGCSLGARTIEVFSPMVSMVVSSSLSVNDTCQSINKKNTDSTQTHKPKYKIIRPGFTDRAKPGLTLGLGLVSSMRAFK